MKYFKNVEAARIYHVSEKSIRNWIEAAEKRKNSLDLHEHNGKHYLANTAENQATIKNLVERGQKYKNSRAQKIIRPLPEFYTLYSPEQIFDMLSNLNVRSEIPLQYAYFDKGAQYWDNYTQRLFKEESNNTIRATTQLINSNLDHIDKLLEDSHHVNVIDLGVGNALPVRGLLEHLLDKELLNRFIGIDDSEEMLKIANQNINEWFSDKKIIFEKYIKDINYDRFSHLTAEDAFNDGSNKVTNLILLFGGTLSNMQVPSRVLQLINDSMGRNDLFLHILKLDSPNSRRSFNFSDKYGNQKLDKILIGNAVSLLGITEDLYETEYTFEEDKKSRFVRIIPKIDIVLEFELGRAKRSILLRKGKRITIMRIRHQSALDSLQEFDKAGFDLLHASKTPDEEHLFTIFKVKTEAPSF